MFILFLTFLSQVHCVKKNHQSNIAAIKQDAQCGKEVTWNYISENKTLLIDGTGPMFNFSVFSKVPYYQYHSLVETIIIQPGITMIGKNAFYSFDKLQHYVSVNQTDIGKDILEGNNRINPYKNGMHTSCDYCPYNEVCGFSPSLGGKGFRKFANLKPEEIVTIARIPNFIDSIVNSYNTKKWCSHMTQIIIIFGRILPMYANNFDNKNWNNFLNSYGNDIIRKLEQPYGGEFPKNNNIIDDLLDDYILHEEEECEFEEEEEKEEK